MVVRRITSALLVLLSILVLVPQAAQALAAVPAARADEAERITGIALASLVERQRPDGRFDDHVRGVVGGGGLPTVGYAALHADGPNLDARVRLALRTLMRGDGATVILRWPLAMTVADPSTALPDEDRARLAEKLGSWGRLQAAGIANRCYVQAGCFNNYKLVDAVLNLELARSSVRSTREGSRLSDPALLRRRTLRWLGTALPRFAAATARVKIPGGGTHRAALLTDPGALPLAYHAMCTAWAVRAVRLAGNAAPQALRAATRRALWALVGLAAPNGEVSWSGRGQDQAWTLAAALYAGATGSRLFASTDPQLAARLRRLADIELRALAGRTTQEGLQILPAGNAQLQGLDNYYSGVGSTGLALTFLEMARDELPAPGARRMAIPGEIHQASFSDPTRSGLVTRRVGPTWMGLRMRRDHKLDPRQDAGLARALRLRAQGWTEVRPARPAPTSARGKTASGAPGAGPYLVAEDRPLFPRATSWRPVAGGVELRGEFRGRTGRGVPARWRYTAGDDGVTLRVRCASGRELRLTEFLPRSGTLQRGARSLARGGARVRLPGAFKARELSTRFANARQPSLAAYRVSLKCRPGWTTFGWTSDARAGA